MSAHKIDARSVVALVVFLVVNILVIFPLHIPLPHAVGRATKAVRESFLGPPEEPPASVEESDNNDEEDGAEEEIVGDDKGKSVALSPLPEEEKSGLEGSDRKRTQSTTSSVPLSPTPSSAKSRVEEDIAMAPTAAAMSDTAGPRDTSASTEAPAIPRSYFTLGLATAPVIGILLLLASTVIPGSVVRAGIVGIAGLRPYDIMTLFICFAYISLSLDRTGLLRYLAFTVAMRASTSGRKLFSSLYALFLVLSLLVGNDPVVLSGTPFVAYFTAHARVPPQPFVFMQFTTANLASALLVSSNPTNLVLTASFGLSFLSFSAWTALPTVAAAAALFPALICLFRYDIPRTIRSPHVVPRSALVDPFGAVWTATIFIATIVLLVGLSAGGKLEHRQGVWTVTAPAAVLVLLRDLVYDLLRPPKALSAAPQDRSEVEQANKAAVGQVNTQGTVHHPVTCLRHRLPTVSAVVAHLPLTLLPFAFSMFILVNALEYTGWVNLWAGWWAAWARVGGVAGCVWLMGMLSVIGCNLFGTNIGATVLLSRILVVWNQDVHPSKRALFGSVLALAVGSNFGAYSLTFSASLAGLLWRDILDYKGLSVRAREFARSNLIPLAVTMTTACLVVAAEVCVMFRDGQR